MVVVWLLSNLPICNCYGLLTRRNGEICPNKLSGVLKQVKVRVLCLLTRGASGYSSLLGNLCVYVSLGRQNPHLAFKTLQN